LRQFGRLDGLTPYLVTTNWASLFVAVVSLLLGFLGNAVSVVMLVAGLVFQINVARLIVTLSGGQIALFLLAQLIGITIIFMMLVVLFPGLMPEMTAALATASAGAAQ
jgi:hypothetical protein